MIAGGLFALLGLAVWWLSGSFPRLSDGHPGPSLFPRLISAGLLLGGGWLSWRSLPRLREGETTVPEQAPRLRRILRLTLAVILVALYPWLQPLVGFVVTVVLISFGVALLLGARPLRAAVTTGIASVAVYWLFTALLRVPL